MHQFCHVGGYVMIQGGSRFSKDIPPYIIAGREPITYSGINIIGLRRRGFSNEVIENIHNAYRIIEDDTRRKVCGTWRVCICTTSGILLRFRVGVAT